MGNGFGPIWTRGMLCVHAQLPRVGTSQGSMGRTVSSFSSSQRRSRWWHQVRCCPILVSEETLKACALIGWRLLAADYEVGSSGSQSPDLGDMWRYGCPKSPDWDGNVGSWDGKRRHFFSRAVRTQRGKPCSESCGARPVR